MNQSDQKIRCFIAVQPEADTITALSSIACDITYISQTNPIKWVPAENLHITMRFLGNINPQGIRNISHNLAFAIKDCKPFDISLITPLLFPKRKQGRIIAALTRNDAELKLLCDTIDLALEKSGIAAEPRRFKGHITLARCKSLIKDDEALRQHETCTTMHINNVTLYQSELTTAGPKYTVIERLNLN